VKTENGKVKTENGKVKTENGKVKGERLEDADYIFDIIYHIHLAQQGDETKRAHQ
jgi:hypothetical protein